ncbi:hypothetical protein ASPACDRAFT_1855104 [Aspergillus aculeatus ATCC 16872]|uniref:Uncharacterized protein n=1 Tax=Aspergillus aculeatus (strain ATCC 16872 / CBS 172.66 / WB 5094) TaxID=690307 RepID=A0A1L9X028_ASPA1|nr:uncharacterized protein ASPACDRAFT_1855104 [Aspergillus aculeatus ATCC 16872]OJK01744.1 hypothetical protein ASPACDRAFT_1855104 [Aspergillus aculeatus ATCC 16872]
MAAWLNFFQIVNPTLTFANILHLPFFIKHCMICIFNAADIDLQSGSMRTTACQEFAMYHESINTLEGLHGENSRPLRRNGLDQETLKKLKKLIDTLESMGSKSLKVKVLLLQDLLKSFQYILQFKQLQLPEEYLVHPKLASEELYSGVRWQQSPDGGTAAHGDLESLTSNTNVKPLSSTFWTRLWFCFAKDGISELLMLINERNKDLSEKAKGIEQVWEKKPTPPPTDSQGATSPSIGDSSESTPGLDGGFEMRNFG